MQLKKWLEKDDVRVAAVSDVGLVRTENEDAHGYFSSGENGAAAEHLFIVADGMGGHDHGREASRTAVKVVRDTFFSAALKPVEERLERALQAANRRIYELSEDGRDSRRAGTTCTTLAYAGRTLYLAHVGDSRAYRIRRKRIEQFSNDHTLTAEMEREGILTGEEARRHQRRHTLTRAVGVDEQVDVDISQLGAPSSRDTFLLCSDGLSAVPTDEIHRVVRSHPIDTAAEMLVRLANDRGGHDNVTVMLIRFN